MKNRRIFLPFGIWRWLIIGALVVSILGATSCEIFFGETGQKINGLIKTCWGVDVTDSNQVALAALIAGARGNKDAYEGLTAYEHCRAAIFREKGDKLYLAEDPQGAREEYERALQWEVDKTNHQKSDKASLYYRIGLTYEQEQQLNPTPASYSGCRIAGQNMLEAAKLQPDSKIKAYFYRKAAWDFRLGGDRTSAIQIWEESLKFDPTFKDSEVERSIKLKP